MMRVSAASKLLNRIEGRPVTRTVSTTREERMPQFTEDWFSGHVPHWERLFFGELEWKPDAPRRLVEIGCFEGRSTLWFLENLLRHPESRIVCIDTFNGGTEHTSAQTEGLFD